MCPNQHANDTGLHLEQTPACWLMCLGKRSTSSGEMSHCCHTAALQRRRCHGRGRSCGAASAVTPASASTLWYSENMTREHDTVILPPRRGAGAAPSPDREAGRGRQHPRRRGAFHFRAGAAHGRRHAPSVRRPDQGVPPTRCQKAEGEKTEKVGKDVKTSETTAGLGAG